MEAKALNPQSPSSSERRSSRTSSDFCNSPEFEFWMLRNPSFPQPNLLSADELFVDGVLRPLHLLSIRPESDPSDQTPQSDPAAAEPGEEPDPGPEISAAAVGGLSASKRWRDIFKKSERKMAEANGIEGKGKKKERRSGGGGGSAELNIINIWPFSRSRSAGNGATRPGLFPGAPGTRKVNSAPCSRSNSAGESKSRKWPSSPGRTGVHLGRSSPVWQVRRSKNPDPNAEKGSKNTSRRSKAASAAVPGGGGSARTRVLKLNVPMCIGYKQHLSCKSDENSAISAGRNTNGTARVRGSYGGGSGGAGSVVGSGGNVFNLRSIFSKKSVVTSH